MTQVFELYDNLVEQVKSNQTCSINLLSLCSTLNDLPPEHSEIVYALILHHDFTCNNGTRFQTVSYNGKVFENGNLVMFRMIDLPPVLQQIIATYITQASK
jgi:hypothetical protein